jgi:hypothetical protein
MSNTEYVVTVVSVAGTEDLRKAFDHASDAVRYAASYRAQSWVEDVIVEVVKHVTKEQVGDMSRADYQQMLCLADWLGEEEVQVIAVPGRLITMVTDRGYSCTWFTTDQSSCSCELCRASNH